MIAFMKNWASGIIVAVIIATIIEMILPDNKNKKYIKTVIGVYVLFTIISPIISHALKDGNFDIGKYEEYLTSSNSLNQLSSDFELDNQKSIQAVYQNQVKEDIKTKLKAKGFGVSESVVELITEEKEGYGGIKKIELTVFKLEEQEEKEKNTTNEIRISKVEIGNTVSQKQNKTETIKITEKEKQQIQEYLAEEYGIKKDKISIQ